MPVFFGFLIKRKLKTGEKRKEKFAVVILPGINTLKLNSKRETKNFHELKIHIHSSTYVQPKSVRKITLHDR